MSASRENLQRDHDQSSTTTKENNFDTLNAKWNSALLLQKSAALGDSRTALVISCLVLQNAGLVLVTKFSYRPSADRYNSAMVILTAEALKLVACWLIHTQTSADNLSRGPGRPGRHLSHISMCIPAALYVIQNNLTFYAIKGMSPTVFILCAQLKILTSALFSVLILNAKISYRQFFAVMLLMSGVALVQLGENKREETGSTVSTYSAFMALLIAVCLSGLAGALLERSFKSKDGSIWVKNLYLSIFSIPFAAYAVSRSVFNASAGEAYYFGGFDGIVWFVIILQALGGLLTAAVMKFAGVVAKCFAVSLSTVLCTFIGMQTGTDSLRHTLIVGAILVNSAVYLYFVK